MIGRDLEGLNFFCLDNKFRGNGFRRKRFRGIISLNFVNAKSLQKWEDLEGIWFFSSFLSQTNKESFLIIPSPSFPFCSFPFFPKSNILQVCGFHINNGNNMPFPQREMALVLSSISEVGCTRLCASHNKEAEFRVNKIVFYFSEVI